MTVSNITVSGNMLEVACTGEVSGDGLLNLINTVKVLLTNKQEVKNILVDLTGIEGKLSFMEHFSIGEGIAKKLKGYKLAVVTKPIVVNKVAENVATKKGASVLMTYDKQKALNWFME